MPIQNNSKRKILCITGTRADYPRVKSVLKEITNCDSIELSIVVTGSHLLEDYGYSVQEIIDDGFDIERWFKVTQLNRCCDRTDRNNMLQS